MPIAITYLRPAGAAGAEPAAVTMAPPVEGDPDELPAVLCVTTRWREAHGKPDNNLRQAGGPGSDGAAANRAEAAMSRLYARLASSRAAADASGSTRMGPAAVHGGGGCGRVGSRR